VILAVHWKDRFLVAEPNQQVASFTGGENASLPFEPSLQLAAGHN